MRTLLANPAMRSSVTSLSQLPGDHDIRRHINAIRASAQHLNPRIRDEAVNAFARKVFGALYVRRRRCCFCCTRGPPC